MTSHRSYVQAATLSFEIGEHDEARMGVCAPDVVDHGVQLAPEKTK